MTQINEDRERQVVPRWRSFAYAAQLGELDSLTDGPTRKVDPKALSYILADWQEEPGLSVACDLVSAAFSVGHGILAEDAARFVLKQHNAPPLAAEIASRCLPGVTLEANAEFHEAYRIHSVDDINLQVGASRRSLRSYPKNPVLWTNLSLMYTVLGDRVKADKAMRVALGLAPDNRFVVRAAGRLYLHQGKFDLAHNVITRSSLVRNDPWVIASEIAISEATNRGSNSISIARRVLESQDFSPFHLSELAGALATTEAKNGSLRKARRLCDQSLLDPSENAIAQAAWLERNVGGIVRKNKVPVSRSHEADAWYARKAENWTESLTHALGWQSEQPFSSRPAIFGSFIASTVLEDFELAMKMLRVAYASNADDAAVLNNLAFAYANLGNLSEAKTLVSLAESKSMSAQHKIALTATKGFIAFRSGDPSGGRRLYQNAIASCGPSEQRLRAIAQLYFAVEEQRVGTPEFATFREHAIKDCDKLDETERSMLQPKITTLHRNPIDKA